MTLSARARTNAVGGELTTIDMACSRGGLIESFRIDTSGRRAIWAGEDLFSPLGDGWYLRLMEDGGAVLGDLLSRDGEWGVIARSMQESGINLRRVVQCVIYKPEHKRLEREVWISGFRYKVMTGRVYGHSRKQK